MEMLLDKISLPPDQSSAGDPFYYVSLINVTQGAFCVFDEHQIKEIDDIGKDTRKVKNGLLRITEVIRKITTKRCEITKKYNNLVYSLFRDCNRDSDYTEDFDKTVEYINGGEIRDNFDPLFELTSKKLSGHKGAGGLHNLLAFEVQYSRNWLEDYFGEPDYWIPEGKEWFILAETMCWGNKKNYYLIPVFIENNCVGGLAFFFENEMDGDTERECNRRAEIFFRKNEFSHPIFNNIIRNYYTFSNCRFFRGFCKSKRYLEHPAYKWGNINFVMKKAKTLDEAIQTSYQSYSHYSEPVIRLVSPLSDNIYSIDINYAKEAIEEKKVAIRLLAYMHANPVFRYFTNHGVYHSYNVLRYTEHIITKLDLILNNYELFILYLAAYYHDMGMLLRSDEYADIEEFLKEKTNEDEKYRYLENKRKAIRDKHNNERLDYFFKHPSEFTFELPPTVVLRDYRRVRNDLYLICRAHRPDTGKEEGGDTLLEKPMRAIKDKSVVNKQLVGAILRLGDTMDYACDRLPSVALLRLKDVPETSIDNYIKHAGSIRLELVGPFNKEYSFFGGISKPHLEELIRISNNFPKDFTTDKIVEDMKKKVADTVDTIRPILSELLGDNTITGEIDIAALDV